MRQLGLCAKTSDLYHVQNVMYLTCKCHLLWRLTLAKITDSVEDKSGALGQYFNMDSSSSVSCPDRNEWLGLCAIRHE